MNFGYIEVMFFFNIENVMNVFYVVNGIFCICFVKFV